MRRRAASCPATRPVTRRGTLRPGSRCRGPGCAAGAWGLPPRRAVRLRPMGAAWTTQGAGRCGSHGAGAPCAGSEVPAAALTGRQDSGEPSPHPRASRDTVGTPQPPQGPRGAPGGRAAGTGRHDPEGGRDEADATPPCQGSKDTHCCLLSVKCRSTLSWKPTSLSASSTCERDKVQGTSGRRVPSEGKARPLLPRAEERNLRDLRCERNSPGNPDYTLDRRRRFKWSNLGKV